MQLQLLTEDSSTIDFTFNKEHDHYGIDVFEMLQPKFVGAMEIVITGDYTSYSLLVRSDTGLIYSIGTLTNVPNDFIPTEEYLKFMLINQS